MRRTYPKIAFRASLLAAVLTIAAQAEMRIVSASDLRLGPGESVQLHVAGAGDETGVVWETTPAGAGLITASGLFTAPAQINQPRTVVITCRNVFDSSMAASVEIELQPKRDLPLNATFLNFYRSMPEQGWAAEFDDMRRDGIDTVMLVAAGRLAEDAAAPLGYRLSGEGLLYPSLLVGPGDRPAEDRLEMVLRLADERGMKVFVGSLQTAGDWTSGLEFEALRTYNSLVAEEILNRYGRRQSLAGWYFTQEIWLNWAAAYGPGYYGTKLLADFVDDVRRLDPRKLVAAAPVFKKHGWDSMPGLTPSALEEVTRQFVAASGLDLFMPQDGVGAEAGAPTAGELPAYFAALRDGVRRAETGAALWSVTEVFTAVDGLSGDQYPPAPIERAVNQIEGVRPYVSGAIAWIYGDHLSSRATLYQAEAAALGEAYRGSFESPAPDGPRPGRGRKL